jgi:hypothetical protein
MDMLRVTLTTSLVIWGMALAYALRIISPQSLEGQ